MSTISCGRKTSTFIYVYLVRVGNNKHPLIGKVVVNVGNNLHSDISLPCPRRSYYHSQTRLHAGSDGLCLGWCELDAISSGSKWKIIMKHLKSCLFLRMKRMAMCMLQGKLFTMKQRLLVTSGWLVLPWYFYSNLQQGLYWGHLLEMSLVYTLSSGSEIQTIARSMTHSRIKYILPCKKMVQNKDIFERQEKRNKTSTTPSCSGPITAQKSRGNSVLGVIFSHTMPKMDFRYSHRFSWEKTH